MRRLAVIASAQYQIATSQILARECGEDWQDNRVESIWLSERKLSDPGYLQRLVSNVAARMPAGEILLVEKLRYTGTYNPTPTTSIRRITFADFKAHIPQILAGNGVDLATLSAASLREKWEMSTVTRDHVSLWLDQFQAVGNYKWVGMAVLSAIQCMKTSDIVETFAMTGWSVAMPYCTVRKASATGAAVTHLPTWLPSDSRE